jgi:hypothetical protein
MLDRRYTKPEREALAAAYRRPGLTARRVATLAAAGALEHPSGHVLAPFTAPENTIRSLARRAEHREEAAAAATAVAELRPMDAVEVCRRRLLSAIHAALTRVEVQVEDGGRVDGTALYRLTRATRELAALSQGLPPPGTHGSLASKALRALHEGGRGAAAVEDAGVLAPHEPTDPSPTHVDPQSERDGPEKLTREQELEKELRDALYGDDDDRAVAPSHSNGARPSR